jgi:hypothetical protein
MTRTFCDTCGAETTNKVSSAIGGIADADNDGNGTVTDQLEVCRACYRSFKLWAKQRKQAAGVDISRRKFSRIHP